MNNSTSQAKDFFNQISDTYKKKYSPNQIFHYYFFTERLEKASFGIDLSNKKVLDIGAGTGDLYDHLTHLNESIIYNGTDVSKGMLENSSIPKDKRFLGSPQDLHLPIKDYDLVYMLGVTTYLNHNQMKEYLSFIKKHTTANHSKIILTFTNSRSIDNITRTILKPFLKLFSLGKRSVLSQNILIQKYSVKDVENLMSDNEFIIEKMDFLNHTIFPFNLIFKRLSVNIARKLDGLSNKHLLSWLSSDIIVTLKTK